MHYWKCDECGRMERSEHEIILKGIHALQGILLPAGLIEKTFCCINCFWAWADKNKPKEG